MTRAELEALIDAGNLNACLSRLEAMPALSNECTARCCNKE